MNNNNNNSLTVNFELLTLFVIDGADCFTQKNFENVTLRYPASHLSHTYLNLYLELVEFKYNS